MPFPLPEDFKPGAPLRDMVTTEIMKTVAGILNHLTVEVREGVDYPYIEKTARPGGQQPWVIVLPAPAAPADAGPDLADTTPLADDDPASAGTAETASRADHKHPLNVYDELEALADNYASAGERAGEFPTYARTDHSHPANTAANPTTFQSRQDGLNNSGQPFGGADIGKGSCGTSGVYADATHSHRLNNMRDNNVVPPGSIPLPVGSNILGDLVDGAGAQVCWACRFGYGPGYASWDHVHPDRLPVVYGTGAYAFRQSQYVFDGSMTTTMKSKDTASFEMRSHVRMDIPVVTRVSMQFKPKTGDMQTYMVVFTRLLSFDYSGRLVAIGPEASSGVYV